MKHWGVVCAVVVGLGAVIPSASANATGYLGSGGPVVGAVEYAQPLPEVLRQCKWAIAFDLRLESAGFVLREGDRTTVGPMELVASGVTACASRALEGGRVEGSLRFATRPDLTCGIVGYYTRVLTDLSLVATASCADAVSARPRFNWVVRLQQVEGTLTGVMTYGL